MGNGEWRMETGGAYENKVHSSACIHTIGMKLATSVSVEIIYKSSISIYTRSIMPNISSGKLTMAQTETHCANSL